MADEVEVEREVVECSNCSYVFHPDGDYTCPRCGAVLEVIEEETPDEAS